jgi:hypothetical protein
MSDNNLLPALVLPNNCNNLDSIAIVQPGVEIPVADFLLRLGSVPSLRFMVRSGSEAMRQGRRLTWQIMPTGKVIVSVAFASGDDSYQRLAFAAIVFDISKELDLRLVLPNSSYRNVVEDMALRIASEQAVIRSSIDVERRLGRTGGELQKKKMRLIDLLLGIVALIGVAAVLSYLAKG